jgi:hypothetical protein
MSDEPRKGSVTGSGLLIALAIAAGMLLTVMGPTSAQFFNFGGYPQQPQQRQRGGGWFVADGLATTRLIRSIRAHPRFGKPDRPCARIFQGRRHPRNAKLLRSATFWYWETAWRTGSPMVSKTLTPSNQTSA